MGRPLCVIKGCRDSAVTRFRFPHPIGGKERFKKWLELIKDKRLDSFSYEEIHCKKRICPKHFEPGCFVKPNRLKYSAIPTLFVPEPDAAKNWDYSKLNDCTPSRIPHYPKPKITIVPTPNNEESDISEPEKQPSPETPTPKTKPAVSEIDKRCRICLSKSDGGIPLNHRTYIDGDARALVDILNKFSNAKISVDDNKPQTICIDCVQKATTAFEFSISCEKADIILQKEMTKINVSVENDQFECHLDLEQSGIIKKLCESHEINLRNKDNVKPIKLQKLQKRHKHRVFVKKPRKVRIDSETKISKPGIRKSIICVQCCKHFSKQAKFKLFTNIIIGKKRYFCDKCGARFALQRNFHLHQCMHRIDHYKVDFIQLRVKDIEEMCSKKMQ